MRFIWFGVLGLAACTSSSTSDGLDEGTAVSCEQGDFCGQSQLTSGRFVSTPNRFDLMAGNTAGELLRAHGAQLAWVDADHRITHSIDLDDDMTISRLQLAPGGGAVVTAGSIPDHTDVHLWMISLDRDGNALWRSEEYLTEPRFAIDDDHVCVSTLDSVYSLDRTTGARLWSIDGPAGDLAALPHGGCAFIGGYVDGATSSALVTAADGAGHVMWTQQLVATSATHARAVFPAIAAASNGSVAVSFAFYGDSATFGGRTIPSTEPSVLAGGTGIALLSPTGDLEQLHQSPMYDEIIALATDGQWTAGSDVDTVMMFGEAAPYAAWATKATGTNAAVSATALALTASSVSVDVVLSGGSVGGTLELGGLTANGSGFIYGGVAR